jgi:cytochrome c-type biogenesis protein CcmE
LEKEWLLEWTGVSKGMVDTMVGGAASKHQFEVNYSAGTNKTLKVQFAGTVSEAPDIFADNDGVVAVGLMSKVEMAKVESFRQKSCK